MLALLGGHESGATEWGALMLQERAVDIDGVDTGEGHVLFRVLYGQFLVVNTTYHYSTDDVCSCMDSL